jgi:N-acetylneuraminate synthase
VTLSRADGGADSAFSLEPAELRQLVDHCRTAWEALGRVDYDLKDSERGNVVFRRSLYICEDLQPGDVLTERNLRAIRPGYGLAPKYLDALIGKRVTRIVRRGTPADWSIVS